MLSLVQRTLESDGYGCMGMNGVWPMRGWIHRSAVLVAVAMAAVAGQGHATPSGQEAATTAIIRRPGWTTTRLIASPHATQAATVDSRHAYAISNTTVACYDRSTGQLLATGTAPDAKHLNSGYLH